MQNGLAYIDNYNDEEVTSDQGLAPSDPFTLYTGPSGSAT
jgi:hypothetical protein